MTSKRTIALLMFAGLLVWATALWPLPRHFASALPVADRSPAGAERVVPTVAGDHIQLLYHFWLARDSFAGRTPLFSNIYEFNSGDDAVRRRFQTYYLPFSAVYAAVSPLFGHAAGWNAAGLFSVLLGLLGAFLLARRLSGSNEAALVASLAFAALPYRWIALVSGSPTGFAVCFVPWLAYGLDRLVRDSSAGGAAIAGVAVFLAFCSDLHVFYFSILSTPLFGLVSIALSGLPGRGRMRKLLIAALPFVALFALAAALSRFASSELGKSTMADGRTMREVMLFSPVMRGMFLRRHLQGATNTIFIGLSTAAFFAVAFACLARRARSEPRRLVAALILSGATLAVVLLAAGAYGPFNALPIRLARAVVPKYTMIRQPAKIFCLLPTLLTAVAALALGPWRRRQAESTAGRGILAGLILPIACAAVLAEQLSWYSTVVSRFDADMPAYRAAAEASASASPSAKAVAIPLWPGDSHFSSIYELGIMSSRLRLLNGYSPSPPADYFDKVFSPLESVNQGELSFGQYSLLKGMGVGSLIFHEGLFPPKVSPFPPGVTLQGLADNPALEAVFSERGTTAFRILDGVTEEAFHRQDGGATSLDFAPATVWGPRQIRRSIETASAPGRINLALRAPAVMRPGLRYMLLDPATGWHSYPLEGPMGGEVPLPDGCAEPSLVLLTAGGPVPDEAVIRPSRLFHWGVSSPRGGSVSFPAGASGGTMLAGPFVPIPAGSWSVEVQASDSCVEGAFLEVVFGTLEDSRAVARAQFAPVVNGGEADGTRSEASASFNVPERAMPFAIRVAGVTSRARRPMVVFSIRLRRLQASAND